MKYNSLFLYLIKVLKTFIRYKNINKIKNLVCSNELKNNMLRNFNALLT